MNYAMDLVALKNLRSKFRQSNLPGKYQVSYARLIKAVNPQAGNRLDSALHLFKRRIGVSRLRTIYDTYCGPAFPGCETAYKRRMFVTQLNKEKLITKRNIRSIPHGLREIVRRCLNIGLEVKLFDRLNNSEKSVSRLKINNHLCRTYIRSVSYDTKGRPRVYLDIKRSSLLENEFIILFCPQRESDKQLSVIPTEVLLNAKAGENLGFTVNLERIYKRRKKPLVDWDSCLNNLEIMR